MSLQDFYNENEIYVDTVDTIEPDEYDEYETGFNPDKYNLKDKDELLRVFDCDINWQKIIINRKFLVTFMTAVLKDNGTKNVRFCGSCVFGFPEDDLTNLIDPYTVDLVSSNLQTRKPRKRGMQYVFKTFREYLQHREPVTGKCNIYFVGDGHGKGEYIDVHWNCFILDLRSTTPVLAWYDPSEKVRVGGQEAYAYNFMPEKKNVILELLKPFKVKNFLTTSRAQQMCGPHPAQDVFCQTWVIMFVDVYLSGVETWSKFKEIDFVKWQNQPLKRWAKCTISRLPKSWLQELQQPMYTGFFMNCRRRMNTSSSDYDADVEKIPEIPMPKNKTCINNVVDYYSQI